MMKQDQLEPLAYLSTVRLAHALADRLKETRPALHARVDELQRTVTGAHHKLHELDQLSQTAAQMCEHEGREIACDRTHDYQRALNDLNTACQSLRDLLCSAKAILPTSSLNSSQPTNLPAITSGPETESTVFAGSTAPNSWEKHPLEEAASYSDRFGFRSTLAKFATRYR